MLAGLLKETGKPEAREMFSNVSSIPQGVDSGALSPSHGFQRDLVRVIGNMCYRHAVNQNKASYLLSFEVKSSVKVLPKEKHVSEVQQPLLDAK